MPLLTPVPKNLKAEMATASSECTNAGGGQDSLTFLRFPSKFRHVLPQNPLHFSDSLRVRIDAVVGGNKLLPGSARQMSAGIGHESIGAVGAVPRAFVSHDRMKRDGRGDRQFREGNQAFSTRSQDADAGGIAPIKK